MTSFNQSIDSEAQLPARDSRISKTLDVTVARSAHAVLTQTGLLKLGGEVVPLGRLHADSIHAPLTNAIFSTGLMTRSGELVVVEHVAESPLQDIIGVFKDGDLVQRIYCEHMVTCLFETKSGKVLVGTNSGFLGTLTESSEIKWNQSFSEVPTRTHWHTPWGGTPDVHSIVQSSKGMIYAAIHVGGILQSSDDGETWTQLENGFDRIIRNDQMEFDILEGAGLNPDVHRLLCHPLEPETMLAATRDGFYISEDGGANFNPRNYGIEPVMQGGMNYQRSMAIFPDRDIWLTASASGPGRVTDSRIFRTDNRAESWTQVHGLPLEVGHIDTLHASAGGYAIALVGDKIFDSTDYGRTWHRNQDRSVEFYRDPYHHVVRPLLTL